MKDTDARARRGLIAGAVGMTVNILLGLSKITVGLLFGSIAVLADGLNNMTDCGGSLLSAISFRLSSRPADKEHPFGHERIEYIGSMVVALLIVMVAFDTAKESIAKILAPTEAIFSAWVLAALGASILLKLGLFVYYRKTAAAIDSDLLRASAVDCLSDCVSTAVAAIATLVGRLTSLNIDGYAGLLVALFIGWTAVGILRDISSKLIGQAPGEEMLGAIKARILSREGVLDLHDLSVYCYGPNKYFASVHIEMDAATDILVAHELIDDIEREFAAETNVVLTGHLDPVITDDEEINALKASVSDELARMDARFSVHDLRLVCGERRTNVLFDVVTPYDTEMTKEEIVSTLSLRLREIDPKYFAVITVEHDSVL